MLEMLPFVRPARHTAFFKHPPPREAGCRSGRGCWRLSSAKAGLLGAVHLVLVQQLAHADVVRAACRALAAMAGHSDYALDDGPEGLLATLRAVVEQFADQRGILAPAYQALAHLTLKSSPRSLPTPRIRVCICGGWILVRLRV